ncbi:MAG: ribulose-phosphate 3-epimerase [Pseudomonadota bacterium]|nr:ribulose-phosphate 3-epimerase [Gammaproteobacteria bacterium]MBU1927091.1 ribulose-phosphate 3-epimerase [Gammaproteobacteria bacterium]MBU2546467.1 ribulose-phosphate 3-epimerase [Gammaproteobacteria bacterium]
MKHTLIAPSILSADFTKLGEEIENVIAAGADMIHFDVMDNHFVPNLTVGPLVCAAIHPRCSKTPIDVHLMTDPVDSLIEPFAKAGASHITFHPEASRHIDRSLQLIKKHGCKTGLAFNPATSLDYLEYVLPKLDLILIMAVNPGFGGQSFIPEMLEKIKRTREIIGKSGFAIDLAVDGGVNKDNTKQIQEAGANILIAGTAIFRAPNYKKAIQDLR